MMKDMMYETKDITIDFRLPKESAYIPVGSSSRVVESMRIDMSTPIIEYERPVERK